MAIRDSDYETMIHAPVTEAIVRWRELYHQVSRANGGEPNAGRHLLFLGVRGRICRPGSHHRHGHACDSRRANRLGRDVGGASRRQRLCPSRGGPRALHPSRTAANIGRLSPLDELNPPVSGPTCAAKSSPPAPQLDQTGVLVLPSSLLSDLRDRSAKPTRVWR